MHLVEFCLALLQKRLLLILLLSFHLFQLNLRIQFSFLHDPLSPLLLDPPHFLLNEISLDKPISLDEFLLHHLQLQIVLPFTVLRNSFHFISSSQLFSFFYLLLPQIHEFNIATHVKFLDFLFPFILKTEEFICLGCFQSHLVILLLYLLLRQDLFLIAFILLFYILEIVVCHYKSQGGLYTKEFVFVLQRLHIFIRLCERVATYYWVVREMFAVLLH